MPDEREHERATDTTAVGTTATSSTTAADAASDATAGRRDRSDRSDRPAGEEALVAGSPVVVRRNAGLAALVGAAASAVAIAYLWRAAQTSAPLDWVLFGVMALVGGYHLAALVDARTPILVADDLGVRIRLGHDWRGLPWEGVGQVVVHPRRGLLRDGRLVFAPRSLARALEDLDARGRRHVALNQKLYGAPLAVPLGTATRLSGVDADTVVAGLEALTLGRSEVVELDPRTHEVVDRDARTTSEEPAGSIAAGSTGRWAPAGAAGSERIVPQAAPGAQGAPSTRGAQGAAGAPAAQGAAGAPAAEAAPAGADRSPAAPAAGGPGPAAPDRAARGRVSGADLLPAAGRADDQAGGEIDPRVGSGARLEETIGTVARPRHSILGDLGTIVSRVGKGRAHDVDRPRPAENRPAENRPAENRPAATGSAGPRVPLAPAAALRQPRPALRAEATISLPTAGSTALDPATGEAGTALPEGRELRRPGSVDLVIEPVPADRRVRPISTLGDPVEPLVIDDFVTEPAYDPVIGPELTAARTRLGLSVDDLAERTRIRPHVIESIEVDDFAPCGGDFYARGHLRTLARILGKDPAPLLATFEERYATAPINARRVFEAELATGMTGSMRATVGGPNWSLLVGVVLSLVLVWGLVRLFTAAPAEMVEMPAPVLNGSAGVAGGYPVDPAPRATVEPVTVLLTAAQADTGVVVRDGDGMVVFSGEMVLGERKTLRVAPPVRVRAQDGGAVTVRVDGRDRGTLGEAGEPVRRTFR